MSNSKVCKVEQYLSTFATVTQICNHNKRNKEKEETEEAKTEHMNNSARALKKQLRANIHHIQHTSTNTQTLFLQNLIHILEENQEDPGQADEQK